MASNASGRNSPTPLSACLQRNSGVTQQEIDVGFADYLLFVDAEVGKQRRSDIFTRRSSFCGTPISRTDPFRVIIDASPGVDDALALLLAMRSPELRIEAITPVAGNVPLELTLPNALRMVDIAGRGSLVDGRKPHQKR